MEIILGGICDNTRPFFTSANPQRLDDLESIAKSVGPSSLPTFAGTPAQPPACQPDGLDGGSDFKAETAVGLFG